MELRVVQRLDPSVNYAEGEELNNIKDFDRMFGDRLRESTREELMAVWLSPSRRVLGHEIVAQGTCNEVVTVSREIMKAGVIMNAFGFVIAHNHPTGNADPSDADIHAGLATAYGAFIMGFGLLDVIVVGADRTLTSVASRLNEYIHGPGGRFPEHTPPDLKGIVENFRKLMPDLGDVKVEYVQGKDD